MAESASSTDCRSGSIDAQQLEQLQGLHLPPTISWWPMAPGWWLLAAVLLIIVLLGFFKLFNYLRKPNSDALWLDQINQCYDDWRSHKQSSLYLQHINRLLRERAVKLSGRHTVAKLTGASWLNYLSKTSAVSPTDELRYLLSVACYKHGTQVEVDRVHTAVEQLARGLTKNRFKTGANSNTNAMTSVMTSTTAKTSQ